MAISITNENKNSLSITNENKLDNPTIDEMEMTIDEAGGTIDFPGTPLRNETKNTLTISNEAKS